LVAGAEGVSPGGLQSVDTSVATVVSTAANAKPNALMIVPASDACPDACQLA
jgi:hypothetical protein